MAYGGPRPRSGRPKGLRNKATVERELQAARAVTAAVETGKLDGQELAKDVLGRFMRLAEGAAGEFAPTPSAQLAQGKAENPNKDWDRFGEWVDRVITCAKALASYQSPTYKAVAVMMPSVSIRPNPGDDAKVINIDDPVSLQRVYQQRVQSKRSA